MILLEIIKSQAWSIVLIIAMIMSVLAFLKVKGKVSFRIRLSLVRGLVFFAILYPPLIDQPKISGTIALPIIGTVILLSGIILVVLGSRELTKTELYGIKGIPEEIITTGLYSIVRHPINLGLIYTFAGWYIVWAGAYSLYFLPILTIGLIIETFWEERNLERVFGDRYKEYKKKVGMFFPKIRKKAWIYRKIHQ